MNSTTILKSLQHTVANKPDFKYIPSIGKTTDTQTDIPYLSLSQSKAAKFSIAFLGAIHGGITGS
jgi:hypothetical protein